MYFLVTVLAIASLNVVRATDDNCFRAAVVEYVPRTAGYPLATQPAENLAIFDKIATRAAVEGAKIIVFPEDAIFDSPDNQ